MSNQTFNFYYDPVRQGYDTDTWTTLSGAPVVAANKLSLTNAGILHFADLTRGDASFAITMAAPVAGDSAKIGFIEYNKGAFLYFNVTDDVLTVESSNGTISSTTVVDWNSDWTNTKTVFRIKWEAGMATFYIGSQFKLTLSDTYVLEIPTVLIPGDSMSLYVDKPSAGALLVSYIEAMGVQSSILSL